MNHRPKPGEWWRVSDTDGRPGVAGRLGQVQRWQPEQHWAAADACVYLTVPTAPPNGLLPPGWSEPYTYAVRRRDLAYKVEQLDLFACS